ncbi:MAG: PQQ-binding-like beta-propeller repeat protein, partial [Verrucomicrobiota bacterium]
KSPANNPVSSDQHIKAPYLTQFMAEPYYIGMPAITTVAGGRTFLAMGHIAHHPREWEMLNRLVARNGYNGQVIWERKFDDDYLVHRSAFVAAEDTFYMIDGDHVLKLDARTGEEQGTIEIPELDGDWKWIAMADGVLYALAGEPGPGAELVKGNRAFGGWSWADLSKGYYGKRIPHGFGDQIAAYDVEKKEVIWKHEEGSLIDARGLAIQDEQFFLYCPDKHIRALNRETGKVLWTNDREPDLTLIEEPGKGLSSTPGWRTQTIVVATPDALVVQGQTRMNVLGISTKDGSMLWQKSKITNNPNAIFIDGEVILGVGEGGSHVAIDPVTGTVSRNLGFHKRACTRLTACPDSMFTRGEGMQRIDRATGKITVDGAVRPACNDGVIPANGLLYLGPWACDCNLSLIGNVARTSAGDFRFDHPVESSQQLQVGDPIKFQPLAIEETDWSTYRGNNQRSASSPVMIGGHIAERWNFEPNLEFTPTEATSAYGLAYFGGSDGKVRAIDLKHGKETWSFATGGVIKYPPTIA